MSNIYNSQLQSNNTDLQSLIDKANALPDAGSVELPTLTNEGSASDLLSGKELIDGEGNVVTGTFTIDDEISNINSLVDQIQTALDGKAAGNEQATPEISVNSSTGLITATAGTKSSTYQLAFQAAKTITPGLYNQIVVSSDRYTVGDVVVKGDQNLRSDNIRYGVNIFGVTGTVIEGGSDIEDELIERSSWGGSYVNPRVSRVGYGAFYHTNLNSIDLPNVEEVRSYAFANSDDLFRVNLPRAIDLSSHAFYNCSMYFRDVNIPLVSYIGDSAFENCDLGFVDIPSVKTIYKNAFSNCTYLQLVKMSAVTNIYSNVFNKCTRLSSVILNGSSVCRLRYSNAFTSTPYAGYSTSFSGTPYIYVPSSLMTSYKTATNWTYFSSYFRAVEDINTNLIVFWIEGEQFIAEEGMTWKDFVESDYTDGDEFIIKSNNTIYWDRLKLYVGGVLSTDVISNRSSYYLDFE